MKVNRFYESVDKVIAKLKKHKRETFAIVVLSTLILTFAHGFAWEAFVNQALGPTYELIPQLDIEVEKRGIGADGELLEDPLEDAEFVLRRLNEEDGIWEQVLYHADGTPFESPTLRTDELGLILLNLQEGVFCLKEIAPPPGFGFIRDDEGYPISEICFKTC